MAAPDRYPPDSAANGQHIGIWTWGAAGVALWGVGSLLILRGSWYSAGTVTENVTFVAVNMLIGAVLGLLAGWFAVPKQRDPRRPGWLW